ncbi:hypothetical protein RHGRI_003432 [Rhododendron griersonianum]|uniref:Lipoxygenase n=1 Tax=Rhododendron griersonianum TaxID=479676 RepID=A0AAV6L4Y7_9ERIC|nr:hypothetical protein RHGRI_003432 [Rhododendron griersonianum]
MGNCSSGEKAEGMCFGSSPHKSLHNNGRRTRKKINGTVVLMKKNVLDWTDLGASFVDRVYELLGRGVSLQLISSLRGDQGRVIAFEALDNLGYQPIMRANGNRGTLGRPAYLENWNAKISVLDGDDSFNVTFDWDESVGIPGAFIIRNHHHSQLYLKTVTLEDVPGHGPVHFVCSSWVYPAHRYKHDRVFFANKTYLPSDTPEPLRYYREQELNDLRGTGSGMLKEWDRVYDYAYYNNLGLPDKGREYARPVLGGSQEYPYPRRGRTGRPPTKSDPNTESRLPLLSLDFYVPSDERFDKVKLSDFLAYALKSVGQLLLPEIASLFDKTPNEFDTFQDVLNLYEGGIRLSNGINHKEIRACIPGEFLKELARSDGERFLKFPMPDVIKADKSAWRTDEEFAREMVAGVNPVVIRRLQEFPPASKLDPMVYGNQTSSMTREQLEKNMNGLLVVKNKKLFILDHHDALMPYLRRINSTSTKTYATRTVLLLQDDGTLKPLAIELSLPHPQGDSQGATSQVFTPAEHGIEGSVWQLAKAYAAIVINAGGVLETTVFPTKYSMELSAVIYKNWNFTEQALPADLLKRGVAIPDSTQPHGLRLLIEDYPYAVDGLEIWSAIETWVREYCSLYYYTDELIQGDSELQSWWNEVRNVGHGDKKDEPWWPEMKTRTELIQTCTIIIWVASALHAAVNFGQWPYAGYLPNRPTVSRRFMPVPGTPEYAELGSNPDSVFLKTITAQFQTLLGIGLIEILSHHSADEVYLGQRDSSDWTSDVQPLEAFGRFGRKLVEIENSITVKNNDKRWKNRLGPVKVPYTLLYPSTSDSQRAIGLSGMGIPNSVSI